MDAIRQGLASVVPLQLLRILTVHDLDLRVCGLPDVDLDYLKVLFGLILNVKLLFPICSGAVSYNVPSWTYGNRPTCSLLLECSGKLHAGTHGMICHKFNPATYHRMS